jgi:hypothetical protein
MPRSVETRIEQYLTRAGYDVRAGVNVEGLYADLVVRDPAGKTYVIEAKSHTGGSPYSRPLETDYVRRLRAATKADEAFVVVPQPARRATAGVITVADLHKRFPPIPQRVRRVSRGASSTPKRRSPARPTPRTRRARQLVFAAMPFDKRYEDVYFFAMRLAAKAIGAACKRVDQEEFVGDIPAKIRHLISQSIAAIVDVSGAKPNVLYEAGFAHARGLPTVHICSTPLRKLPFDISHDSTLEYSLGQTHELATRLRRRLKAVVKHKAR